MGEGNFNSFNFCDRVVRPTSQYPATRSAASVVGHGARQNGLTDSASSFSSGGYQISETFHRSSASPRLDIQNNSGHHLQARNRQRGQGFPVAVDCSQRQLNRQNPPHSPLYQSDLDKPSLAPALETMHTSLPLPLPTNNSALVSLIREHRGSEPALPGPGCHPRPSRRRDQPPTIVESNVVSFHEAQQAALVTFDARSLPVNDPQYPNQAVNEHRFVAPDEEDPGKRRKRTDGVDDRRRKKAISKRHGACLGCRNTRKRCDGQDVCNRCRRLGIACLRTCSLCRAKHLACDDVTPCQNCHVSGAACIRPSAGNITTPRSHHHHNPPPASPPLQAEPPKPSAQLKNHTMLETTDLDAPVAWRFGFEVKSELQQEHERRPNQYRQIDPPMSPRTRPMVPADLQSDESARGVNSGSAHIGSRRYSQQATDVNLHPSLTQGSTAVASEKDCLKVPNRQDTELESCSRTTVYSHFEEAWCEDRGYPQPKGITGGYPWPTLVD